MDAFTADYGSFFDDSNEGLRFHHGKHAGKLLTEVAEENPQYLEWAYSKADLKPDAKEAVAEALKKVNRKPPVSTPSMGLGSSVDVQLNFANGSDSILNALRSRGLGGNYVLLSPYEYRGLKHLVSRRFVVNDNLPPLDEECSRLEVQPTGAVRCGPATDDCSFNDAIATLDGESFRIVVARHMGITSTESEWALVCFQGEATSARRVARILCAIHRQYTRWYKTLTVVGSGPNCPLGELEDQRWEDIILPPALMHKLRADVEGFLASRDFYKKYRLPWRRGYLLTGPAGNGKTMVARTIGYLYDVLTYIVDLFDPDLTDAHLLAIFRKVSEVGPSLILMEDLDRLVEQLETRSRVTLSGLLNAFDGVMTNSGLITIATANHPETLDPAIRLRPGRFDVPVQFNNPDDDCRHRLVLKHFPDMPKEVVDRVASAAEGKSAAFVVSICQGAHSACLARGGNEVLPEDLDYAIESSVSYYDTMETNKERGAGFRSNGPILVRQPGRYLHTTMPSQGGPPPSNG